MGLGGEGVKLQDIRSFILLIVQGVFVALTMNENRPQDPSVTC